MKLLPTRKKNKPAIRIKPRRMGFSFAGMAEKPYWFDNDPVLTHLLNVLSLTFPDGERFFVDSVRTLRDHAPGKQRQQEISGFIGQEAMHSLEHQAFNDLISKGRYDDITGQALGFARKMLAGARKYLSAQEQLAATAGLEHITAILADAILKRPDLIEKMHPSVRPLWIWHAIEETEHKAVAYDLYKEVSDSYLERQRTFLTSSFYLVGFTSYYTWQMLKRDNVHRRPLVLAKGLWTALGYRGVISSVIPAWLSYLKPGFHPWDDDNSALINEWRASLPPEQERSLQAVG